jgi:hypothetical protein
MEVISVDKTPQMTEALALWKFNVRLKRFLCQQRLTGSEANKMKQSTAKTMTEEKKNYVRVSAEYRVKKCPASL